MSLNILTQLIFQYKYFVLIPAALIGGPIVSLFAGSLIRLGYIALLPTYLSLIIGELIGDVVWYWIGYRFGDAFTKKFGIYFGIKDVHIRTIKRLFRDHQRKILFFSKVTMGLGFSIVTLFTAGFARVPFRHYLAVNIVGQIIWSGALISVGFLFGHLFSETTNTFLHVILITVYIIIFVIIVMFEKILRDWFMTQYQE